jgi:hypothetical protein
MHAAYEDSNLAPIPVFDGGVILKWKLVEASQSPNQADQSVRKVNLDMGANLLGTSAGLSLTRKRRLVGRLLAAGGMALIAAGLGWLKY